jgi:hypothetical protein
MSARMTRPEAVTLCRLAKAACPQQAFDEYTPDAWFELLSDLLFEDCKAALFAVAKTQPFVSPSEIRAAVRRVRYDRLDKFGPIPAPPDGSVMSEIEWGNQMIKRIADGELTREQWDADQPALTKRDMRVIEGTFRTVDEEPA